MSRGYAWLDTGTHESLHAGCELHRDPGAPARTEDRLPRGDRLPDGLTSTLPPCRRWRQPMRNNEYGKYLLALAAERPGARDGL